MSYNANFAALIENEIGRRRELGKELLQNRQKPLKEAKSLELLAEQFRAGDFDADKMTELVRMHEEDSSRSDAAAAVSRCLALAAIETDCPTADDLLDLILQEAGQT